MVVVSSNASSNWDTEAMGAGDAGRVPVAAGSPKWVGKVACTIDRTRPSWPQVFDSMSSHRWQS